MKTEKESDCQMTGNCQWMSNDWCICDQLLHLALAHFCFCLNRFVADTHCAYCFSINNLNYFASISEQASLQIMFKIFHRAMQSQQHFSIQRNWITCYSKQTPVAWAPTDDGLTKSINENSLSLVCILNNNCSTVIFEKNCLSKLSFQNRWQNI